MKRILTRWQQRLVANASLETRAYVPLSEEDVKAIYQASMTNGLTA